MTVKFEPNVLPILELNLNVPPVLPTRRQVR